MKSALIYDWLVNIGGGEKTLAAIAEVFPAPIFTLVVDEKGLKGTAFETLEITPSFLQKFPFIERYYRYYLPFFPSAIERLDLTNYDCLFSVSHAVAKGIMKRPDQVHLCYCFTPMRYAWDLFQCYMQSLSGVKKFFAERTLSKLREWDLATHRRVDHFATLSHYIAERIKRIYGREAEVIYPPVDTDLIDLEETKEDYYITVSRMVPYKKIDLIVEAFSHCPDKKLIVIGDGPEMGSVKKKAAKNIEILGHMPDAATRKLLRKAKAFVFAAEEDFGIAPVEAQAAGTPVIAFGKGGVLETVVANETGIFFDEQTVSSMIQGLLQFENMQWNPIKIRNNALRFNKQRFQQEILNFIRNKIEEPRESHHSCRR